MKHRQNTLIYNRQNKKGRVCFILIIILFIFCIICVKTPVGLTLSFIHAHTSASTMGKSSFCPTSFLSVSE